MEIPRRLPLGSKEHIHPSTNPHDQLRVDVRMIPLALAQQLTDRIPSASLAVLPGASVVPFLDDMEVSLSTVEEFLGEKAYGPVPAPAVHTILFTDLEASTALTNRLRDAAAQELVRAHNTIVREALVRHATRFGSAHTPWRATAMQT